MSQPYRRVERAIRLAKRMIRFNSASHLSNRAITQFVAQRLRRSGLAIERLSYRDAAGVRKFSLVGKLGQGNGGLAYFGHSDTVPAERWYQTSGSPFEAMIEQERLYGRGACDMKASIACMLAVVRSLRRVANRFQAPFYFVVTSDEEVGYGGARHIVKCSKFYREMVDGGTRAIIGEPTSMQVVYAHKGSILLTAVARGRAAHSSTDEGVNANLAMIPFLADLTRTFEVTETDVLWRNDDFDPPTPRWNLTFGDNCAAINVTPATSVCRVYFRPMPGQDTSTLIRTCGELAHHHGLEFDATVYGNPMRTNPESAFVTTALRLTGQRTPRTAAYGTDGGALGELAEKIVLGPGNIAQAHTDDEWISLEQIALAVETYRDFLHHYCLSLSHGGSSPNSKPAAP